MSSPIEKPFLLFVEGKDDEAVVGLLLRYLGVAGAQIFNAKGKDRIRDVVNAFVVSPGFDDTVQGVAILRDADADPAAALWSCQDSLKEISKRTGVFLLTGDGPGVLEDLCLRTLQGRTELECVDRYLECLGTNGITLRNASKFRMRALLTAMDDGKSRDTDWAELRVY